MNQGMPRVPVALGDNRAMTVFAVYASALLHGVALIMFPAAGSLFTDPDFHGLSSAQFGGLFTPQIIAAIIASLWTANLARRFGMKRVLQMGMLANVAAMLLMALSSLVTGVNLLAFGALLLGTASVGAGFGLGISALNAYAFDLFRSRANAAVTALHVLAGVGQFSAPLILAQFVGLGFWWGAPLVVVGALGLVLALQVVLSLRLSTEGAGEPGSAGGQMGRLPLRVWIFAVAVFLYGVCEATFGNWATIFLEDEIGLLAAEAALGLSVFWGSVTLGRILYTVADIWLKPQVAYYIVPFVVALVFVGLPLVSGFTLAILLLALGGLGLSFFFPLSVSLASAEAPARLAAASGLMVASIQLGVGFSANVVGLLRNEAGVEQTGLFDLGTIFQFTSLSALLMGVLVIYLRFSARQG